MWARASADDTRCTFACSWMGRFGATSTLQQPVTAAWFAAYSLHCLSLQASKGSCKAKQGEKHRERRERASLPLQAERLPCLSHCMYHWFQAAAAAACAVAIRSRLLPSPCFFSLFNTHIHIRSCHCHCHRLLSASLVCCLLCLLACLPFSLPAFPASLPDWYGKRIKSTTTNAKLLARLRDACSRFSL